MRKLLLGMLVPGAILLGTPVAHGDPVDPETPCATIDWNDGLLQAVGTILATHIREVCVGPRDLLCQLDILCGSEQPAAAPDLR